MCSGGLSASAPSWLQINQWCAYNGQPTAEDAMSHLGPEEDNSSKHALTATCCFLGCRVGINPAAALLRSQTYRGNLDATLQPNQQTSCSKHIFTRRFLTAPLDLKEAQTRRVDGQAGHSILNHAPPPAPHRHSGSPSSSGLLLSWRGRAN